MRYVSFFYQGVQSYGITNEEFTEIINLPKAYYAMKKQSLLPKTLQAGIELGEEFTMIVKDVEQWVLSNKSDEFVYHIDDRDFQLLSPVVRPQKNVFCIGKNYREHVLELGEENDVPTSLMVFSKTPTTVIGHKQNILRHGEVTNCLDYEGELAVVIGKVGKAINMEDVYDHVFGYTILNDVTARDLQKDHKQFLLGKSLDNSCPIGPILITKDEIENPQELTIETKVNGEVRQLSNTSYMMFDIPTIISTISRGMTLEPGDIIATGTPAGVGKGFTPPKYLNIGDVIEVTIEKIGTLSNVVIK